MASVNLEWDIVKDFRSMGALSRMTPTSVVINEVNWRSLSVIFLVGFVFVSGNITRRSISGPERVRHLLAVIMRFSGARKTVQSDPLFVFLFNVTRTPTPSGQSESKQ